MQRIQAHLETFLLSKTSGFMSVSSLYPSDSPLTIVQWSARLSPHYGLACTRPCLRDAAENGNLTRCIGGAVEIITASSSPIVLAVDRGESLFLTTLVVSTLLRY